MLATFYGFLGTIDEHSAPAPWNAIQVLGLSPQDVSRARVLEQLSADAVSIVPGESAFIIRRTEALARLPLLPTGAAVRASFDRGTWAPMADRPGADVQAVKKTSQERPPLLELVGPVGLEPTTERL